jgi:hypothetical protein
LLCANCELILDAARIPNQPSPSEISVVRRMLERPQTGVPTSRPATSGPKKYEPPTRVLPQRANRIPLVVASLSKKMAALSELEAFVVSFIDGENDVAELARKTGMAMLEMNGVLQSLNDKMVIDFADEPTDERPKPVVTGSSPTIKFDPDAFQVPESKPRLEPLSFLPTPVTESRLAAREVDEARAALVEPATFDQPATTLEDAERPGPPVPEDVTASPPVPLAQTQPLEAVGPSFSTAQTQVMPVVSEPPSPAPSPPQRQRPSESPPPHALAPPERESVVMAPPAATPPAAPSAPVQPASLLAPAPELVLPPPVEKRPRRVLKSRGVVEPAPATAPSRDDDGAASHARAAELERLPSTHSTAPTPPAGTLEQVSEGPAGDRASRPTLLIPVTDEGAPARDRPTAGGGSSERPPSNSEAAAQLPAVESRAGAADEPGGQTNPDGAGEGGSEGGPGTRRRPAPTLIDPELQKMLHSFRSAAAAPASATPPSMEPAAPAAAPSVVVSPIVTPPEPLEAVDSAPRHARPRRTLPANARSSSPRPAPPLKLDEGQPRSSPLPAQTVPLADAPSGNTDPRILHRGQGNRRILDALKRVKRRETSPEVVLEDPSDHGTTADRLAAGTLQVAIRMEQGGRLDEAIRYLEQAIGKSPDAPTLYNRLAIIVLRERADLLRAEELLQKAIELAPGNEVYEKNLQAVLSKRAMQDSKS